MNVTERVELINIAKLTQLLFIRH